MITNLAHTSPEDYECRVICVYIHNTVPRRNDATKDARDGERREQRVRPSDVAIIHFSLFFITIVFKKVIKIKRPSLTYVDSKNVL